MGTGVEVSPRNIVGKLSSNFIFHVSLTKVIWLCSEERSVGFFRSQVVVGPSDDPRDTGGGKRSTRQKIHMILRHFA